MLDMEITDEIKIKIIAQYLGQNVVIPENYQFSGLRTDATIGELTGIQDCFIKINGISGFYPYKDFKLILKPLSSITNEDCVFMLKMTLGENYSDVDEEKNKKIFEIAFLERKGFNSRIYQYLMSRGYDLPQYLLEDKTLQQSGLAIYEN